MEVTGQDLSSLDNESGGHRIQRVPPTERKGRVHTSTVVVTVMEEMSVSKITFNEKEFKIEWYSGTGSGGQHRNKHQNSCRITHIESGVVATAQTRSRENSLESAKRDILERLSRHSTRETKRQFDKKKKELGGSGERGDKIRTYMFQHGKVTDQRSGLSIPIEKIMSGGFMQFWSQS